LNLLLLFSIFQSVHLSDSYAEALGVDPYVQPSDVDEATYHAFRNRNAWRDQHAMERVTYSDPTFRGFLSTNERAPGHTVNCGDCERCGASCRRYCECAEKRRAAAGNVPRIKSVPSEDLVYTLQCADGPISFGRKALMLLRTEQRAGRVNVRACTIEQVRALIGGGAA
jgi:hypothetical protein